MNPSMFDPSSFLDSTLDQPLEKRSPLPEGDYLGTIAEVTGRQWQSKDGSKSGVAFDVQVSLEIPAEVQATMGFDRPTLTVRDSIMLDLTAQGTIDQSKGKNNRLRLYREALDMNKPGESFSPRKMIGQPLRARVKHEPWEDTIQERIATVTRI